MHKITLISTIHKQIGKCNLDELSRILEILKPDVIFLEALEDTYSKYQEYTFSNFEVYHNKLEISAIQKYSIKSLFEYVPVLEKEMPNSFDKRFKRVTKNTQFQKMIENFNSLASRNGFDFLNSDKSIRLHEKMSVLGDRIINDKELNKSFYNEINEYENSMLNCIYKYCLNNEFKNAIFMCGNGHRRSIIHKIESCKNKYNLNINWKIFGTKIP